MEVQVRHRIPLDILDALQLHILARAQSQGNNLIHPFVDNLLVHAVDHAHDERDALLHVLERLEVARQRRGLDARGAGDHLGRRVGHHHDLEGQGEHVLVEARGGERGGGWVGGGFCEEGGEGGEGVFGDEDGGVVEGEAHDGWFVGGFVVSGWVLLRLPV